MPTDFGLTPVLGGRNIFTEAATQKYVDEALASVTIPPGARGGLFAYYTLNGIFKLVAVQKIGDRWAVGVQMQRDIGRGIQGAVVCRGFW